MKDEVINILQMPKCEESINKLCEMCDILKFQAINIIDEYKSIVETTTNMLASGMDISNYNILKQNIIRGLTSGEYSRKKNEDLKNEVLKLLKMQLGDEVINKLCITCELNYEEAKSFIERYQELESMEVMALRNGQDSSAFNKEKWEIINRLTILK